MNAECAEDLKSRILKIELGVHVYNDSYLLDLLYDKYIELENEYRHALRELNGERLNNQKPAKKERLPKVRVVEAARLQWVMNIHEPPAPHWEEIDKYIRSKDGLGWDWEQPYTRNGQFQWCGAFAAWCYRQIGLSYQIRRHHMASCYRLYTWAKSNDCLVSMPIPGDIVIVGVSEKEHPLYRKWGNHITICETVQDEGVSTFEGNAKGTLGTKKIGEGVVRQFRPFKKDKDGQYVVRHIVRFAEEHFLTP